MGGTSSSGVESNGQTHVTVFQVFQSLGGRVIVDFQLDGRMLRIEKLQIIKEKTAKSRLAGADADRITLKAVRAGEQFFPHEKLLTGRGHMVEKFFPFRSQSHALPGTDEKRTAQLLLQDLDHPGNGRLAGIKQRRRLGDTFIFGDIIKNLVILKIYRHNKSSFVIYRFLISCFVKKPGGLHYYLF